MKQKKIILASSSPRRQNLIHSLDLPYEVIVSHVDEVVPSSMSPAEIVEILSKRKAIAVFQQLQSTQHGIVIGADTIVVLDGQVLGKPIDAEDAFNMLKNLQGNKHEVYSGVTCIDVETGQMMVNHCVTTVVMKSLSDEQIRRYIHTSEPLDKAGSYAIQGLGSTLVTKIQGDYFNVVGLPLSLLSDMLAEYGVYVV